MRTDITEELKREKSDPTSIMSISAIEESAKEVDIMTMIQLQSQQLPADHSTPPGNYQYHVCLDISSHA